MSRRLTLLFLVLSAVLAVVPANAQEADAGIESGSEIEVLTVAGITLQVAPRAD